MSVTQSAVQICNLGLNRVGVLQTITSLNPPDNTPAGVAASLVYDFCRQIILAKFPWPWASKYTTLAVVATNPNQEWRYAYQYPTDALFVRRVTVSPTAANLQPYGTSPGFTFDRSDTNPNPPPFEVGYLNSARVIYTDLQYAACKYTFDQTDTGAFTPEFVNLLAWRLAIDFADSLANDAGQRERCEKMYQMVELKCAAIAMNEAQNSQPSVDYNSATVRARW